MNGSRRDNLLSIAGDDNEGYRSRTLSCFYLLCLTERIDMWYTFHINMNYMKGENDMVPKGHYIFGTVKVGERGQIVIPREARDKFDIKAGDTLIVLGDEKWGLAVTKSDVLQKFAADIYKKMEESTNEGV